MDIAIGMIKDAWVPLMSLTWFLVGLLMGMKWRGGRRGGYAGGSAGSHGGGRVNSPEIYVGNLDENAAEGDIRKAFGKFGLVKDVRVVNSRADGTNKVFAFITMGGVAEAQAAVDGMNGRDLGGRKVVVSEARSRRHRGHR